MLPVNKDRMDQKKRRSLWILVRWVGGPIVLAALVWVGWATSVYVRTLRYSACNEISGFWDDDSRTCFFLDCRGRIGEFEVTGPPGWKCAVSMK